MFFFQKYPRCFRIPTRDESRDNPDPEIPGFGQIFQSRNPGIEVSGSRDHEIIWKCRHFEVFHDFLTIWKNFLNTFDQLYMIICDFLKVLVSLNYE